MNVDALDRIRTTILAVARRRRIGPFDREDLIQDVLVDILDRHPGWLCGASGRGVPWAEIDHLVITWLRRRIGRWRPSTAARRYGQLGIHLERLVLRDRWTSTDAVETIAVSSAGSPPRAVIEQIANSLHLDSRASTERFTRNTADSTPACSSSSPDAEMSASAARAAVTIWLGAALRELCTEDQRMLALKFCRDMTMAEIAAALGRTPGNVQKRFERLKPRLRACLEAHEVSVAEVCAAFETSGPDWALLESVLVDEDRPAEE